MEQVINRRNRVAEVRVKLQPELLQQFDAVAQGRGVPASTLAALVIGEFVEKHAENKLVQRLVALDMTKRLATQFDESAIAASFAGLDPAVMDRLFASIATAERAAGQAGSSVGPEVAAPPCDEGAGGDRVRTAT